MTERPKPDQANQPMIRKLKFCPRCFSDKAIGLVVCWSCNHDLKRMHGGGYGPFEPILTRIEAILTFVKADDTPRG
jgi:hypothetical protein